MHESSPDVPPCVQHYFDDFSSGEYARRVREVIQPTYYTSKQVEKPGYQFRTDRLPFLFGGDIENAQPKVATWGINPKTPSSRGNSPMPSDVASWYHASLNAFADPPSSFHMVYGRFIAGARNRALGVSSGTELPHDWWQRHYVTFDMVPWHADAWGVTRLTEPRVALIRDHFECCEELVKSVDLRLLIFNGKPFEHLFVRNQNRPLREFEKKGGFSYGSITGKKHGGEVVLGQLKLGGRFIPALILTVFIHQARPPCRADELAKLGYEAYGRFGRAGLRLDVP